jgi:PhnB protein
MKARPQGIPENSSVVIPRLVCRDVEAEIDFCASTFAAVDLGRRSDSDGMVIHALMTIGPAMIMIERESSMTQSRAPAPDGSSPVVIFVYVEDVDRTVERALSDGARLLMPPQNQFWGDRTAWIMDPAGHVWTMASRIEATTDEERDRRWADIVSDQPKP